MILVNLNVRTGEPIHISSFVWSAGVISTFEIGLGWFWALGTRLNKKVPEEIRMKSKFFRFGLIYSAICFFFIPFIVDSYSES